MIDRPGGGDPARRDESPIGGDARIADLPRWAHAADAAAIALVIVALFVLAHGGFVLQVLGLRLSIRSEWRLFAWAAGLIVVRHLIIRRPPIHRSVASRVAGAARDPGPLIDDIAFFDRKATPRTTQPTTSRYRTAVGIIGVFVLYAGLTALMTYPQVTHMRSVSPDHADPLLSTWRLSWIAYQLPRDPLHLFDANIFYPERHALAFSDSMLVPALTVAPLVWLGVHPLTACNILLLSGFVLSGVTMFVLVRSLTRQVAAALFAGFIFAFLPYRFMHYAHLELQMSQWMPLCLWAFHRTMTDGRLRDGLLTGLFLALQTLSSWYYGIFFASFLVPVFAALVMGARRGQGLRALKPLVAGAVLAVVIVTPFVLPYFAARASVGERPRSEIEFYSAKPQDYLVAHPRNVFFGPLSAGRGSQERELFQGVVVPLIALVGFWPPLSAARIGYALGLVFAFEVSLGSNGLLHPWLHAYVLPYRGLRVTARMGMVVGLALAILAGYGFARIATRIRGRLAASAALGAIALAVFLEDPVDTLAGRDLERTAGGVRSDRPRPVHRRAQSSSHRPRCRPRAELHVLLRVSLAQAGQRIQRVQPTLIHAAARRDDHVPRRWLAGGAAAA